MAWCNLFNLNWKLWLLYCRNLWRWWRCGDCYPLFRRWWRCNDCYPLFLGGGGGVTTATPWHLPSGVLRPGKEGFTATPFTADFTTGGTGASDFAFLQAGVGTGNSDLTSPPSTVTSDPTTYDREGRLSPGVSAAGVTDLGWRCSAYMKFS